MIAFLQLLLQDQFPHKREKIRREGAEVAHALDLARTLNTRLDVVEGPVPAPSAGNLSCHVWILG